MTLHTCLTLCPDELGTDAVTTRDARQVHQVHWNQEFGQGSDPRRCDLFRHTSPGSWRRSGETLRFGPLAPLDPLDLLLSFVSDNHALARNRGVHAVLRSQSERLIARSVCSNRSVRRAPRCFYQERCERKTCSSHHRGQSDTVVNS